MSSRDPLPDAVVETGAAVQCRHCHRPLTRHQGIGGVQWRDDSPPSAACFKARSLTHDPEPIPCWFCSHIHTETLICRAVAIDGGPCVCRYDPFSPPPGQQP